MNKITTKSRTREKKDPGRWLNARIWDFETFGVDPDKTPQELLSKLARIASIDYVISNGSIKPRTAQNIYDDLVLLGATQEEINKLRKETATATITKQCAVKGCDKVPWCYAEGYKQSGLLTVSLVYLVYCDKCWRMSSTSLDALLRRLYDETLEEVEIEAQAQADNKNQKE